jgi:Cu2+-containing amine oxidase
MYSSQRRDHEEICNLCYKNWGDNQSLIKAQFPCKNSFRYEPIRFSEPREISIPRYSSCTKNQKEEALISEEKEKVEKIYRRWLDEQRKIIMKLADIKEKEIMDDFYRYRKEIIKREARFRPGSMIKELWE